MSPTSVTLAIAAALVVFDIALVAGFYGYLRARPPTTGTSCTSPGSA